MKTKGKVTGIVSNLVTVQVDGPVAENELCYITLAGTPLLAEVIKVSGDKASVQVFRKHPWTEKRRPCGVRRQDA